MCGIGAEMDSMICILYTLPFVSRYVHENKFFANQILH